ncbi:MAG: heavy metal-associated domain-containing protein [Actinomycetaceae bacterium]|nr:cation transporter [Arcanobacterium sp.]MDD7504487.1 heavy metal-associated domain-containing protein [Actinomycetaceae bacterium]
MALAKFQTTEFTCPSCVRKIETNVRKLDGVSDVKVMFNSNKVKVDYDDAVITTDSIAHLIEDLGYPVERVATA